MDRDRRARVGAIIVFVALVWLTVLPIGRAATGARAVRFEGRYVVTVADRTDGAEAIQRWLMVGGRRYRLHVAGEFRAKPGQRMAVEGTLTGDRLEATDVEAIGPAPAHAMRGVKDVLVELVTWTEPDDVRRRRARIQVGETDRHWYEEVSYGRLSLTATVTPWMQIPEPAGCDIWAIRSAADAAAVAAGYDPTAYEFRMIYYPFFGDCNWAGLGEIGGPTTWINGFMDSRVTIHELGHTLGLLHSSDYVCRDDSLNLVPLSSNCAVSDPYGDPFSAMGHGLNGMAHFAPSQKKYLGWMDGRIERLRHDADVLLAPIEPAGTGLPQALRIDAPFATYWVDYRQPIGVDWWMTPTVTDGVLVRINGRNDTFLLDMRTIDQWHEDAALPLETPFTDPTGVTIRAHDGSASGVTVSVSGLPPGRARWGQYKLGPGHTGNQYAETAIGPDDVAALERVWAQRFSGHVVGPPVLGDGTLFFLHSDPDLTGAGRARVHGLSSATGAFASYHTVCNTPAWPIAVARHSALFPGTQGCAPGAVSAIDTRNNGLRWSLERSGPIVVSHGVVYGPIPDATGLADLRAVEAGSGRILWSADTSVAWDLVRRAVPSVLGATVYLAEGHAGAVASGDRVYATGTVHAFDVGTGNAVWQASCAPRGRLCALDAATGTLVWSAHGLQTRIGEPAVDARSVVATCGDGLCGFDRATGALRWQTPPEIGCAHARLPACRPIIANGVTYAPSADGVVRTFRVRSGTPLAHFRVGGTPTVIVANGTMYTTTGGGVRAYRLPPSLAAS